MLRPVMSGKRWNVRGKPTCIIVFGTATNANDVYEVAVITSQCSADGMNCDTNSLGAGSNERKKTESPSLANDSMPVCMTQVIGAWL